jgi:hypothetical protein
VDNKNIKVKPQFALFVAIEAVSAKRRAKAVFAVF